jgi:2-phosphosulfolactate phosphatase
MKIEVCYSPALLHLFDTTGKNVVIIDIFRATSTIVAALANGAAKVIPVDSVARCIEIGNDTPNSITAGERDGQIADGLVYGNSPLTFTKALIQDKTLVLTTTNGTRLLHMVQNAHRILIGSFLNLDAIIEYLVNDQKDVILACASWKDRYNLEDTLFAGAVVYHLQNDHQMSVQCDSAIAASQLYTLAKGQVLTFLKESNHYKRLSNFGLQEDLAYCTTLNKHPIVPYVNDEVHIVI